MADSDLIAPYENFINDEVPSLNEENYEVPEVIEPKICCRCSQSIDVSQEVFDTDSCAHHVCVNCRFREDLNCSVCNPHHQKVVTSLLSQVNDNVPNNFLKDFTIFMKRKKVTKHHIVNLNYEGGVQKQMCSVCKRVFKSSNARYHYMCASQDKPFTCVECGKQFVKKSHMEAHLNSHFGIKPFKCNFGKCTSSFMQKDKLVRHMKSHNKDKEYKCTICNKNYSSQDSLNFHKVRVHSSVKPFQCDLCPRSYKYKKSLNKHKLKHQAIKEFMCEICGKKYSMFDQLRHHKRSHIVYHRRPHKCACGRRFMTRGSKARHQLTHNPSRDFECSLCNTTFGRKDNLERHMKNFHEDNLPKSGKDKQAAVVSPLNNTPPVTKNKKLSGSKNNKPNIVKAAKKLTTNNCKIDQVKNLKKCKSVSSNKNLIKTANSDRSAVEKHVEEKSVPTVIVPNKPPQSQQRPSVIRCMPKLLPYRVLPPGKRYLMSTDESNGGKSPSDLMPPPGLKKYNDKHNRIATQKSKVPKDVAFNKCFRIIQHTSSVQQSSTNCHSSEKLLNDTNVIFNGPHNAAEKPNEENSNEKVPVPNLLLTPTNAIDQEMCRIASDKLSFTQPSIDNSNASSKCLGGPILPTSLIEVLEVGDTNPGRGDNFSYVPLGESSSSTYTPYFDSDCFRDGGNNSYEDFDMGFQCIGESFSEAEISLSVEAKDVKYVSQKTMVVKKC